MSKLSDSQIMARLQDMQGWEYTNGEIVREFTFDSFIKGIEFVNSVANEAEAENHHPNMDIRYKNIRISISTHDAGGITPKDFLLAEQINKLS